MIVKTAVLVTCAVNVCDTLAVAVDDTVIVELTEPDEVDVSVADIVEEYEKCVVDDGVDEIVVKELCEPLLEGDPVSEAEEVLECVIVILDVYEDD